MTRLLNESKNGIALLQEPWVVKGAVRGIKYGETHYAKVDHPRACVVTGEDINAWFLPQYSNRDTSTVRVEGIGADQPIIVCAAYLTHEDNEVPPQILKNLVDYCDQQRLPLIIGADVNAHHTSWGSTDINEKGEKLLEYLVGTTLDICNVGNKPTFITRTRREVLDVTFATTGLSNLIKDWRVSDEESFPDHQLIRWELERQGKPRQFWHNPRKCNWDLYRQEMTNIARPEDYPTETTEELQRSTTLLTGNLGKTFRKCCPRSLRGNRALPAWPPELKNLQLQARRAQRRAYATNLEEDWDNKRETLREFKKELRKFKDDAWQRYCSSFEELAPTARLVKMLKLDRRIQLGMLEMANGEYTNTPEEALDTLLQHHFPRQQGNLLGSQDLGNLTRPGFSTVVSQSESAQGLPRRGGNQHTRRHGPSDCTANRLVYGLRPAATPHVHQHENQPNHVPMDRVITERIVTKERVMRAIDSFKPYKAAGADGIIPIMLKAAGECIVRPIMDILRGSLRLGYIPQEWRKARIAFLPKPGKDTYAKASSYRPISLTSFLLKTMEKVLDYYNEVNGQVKLHCNQHAYTKGKSTETALHQLISRVEEVYNHGEYALIIFFDISGAFDRVTFRALEEAMDKFRIPDVVKRWTMQMLQTRSAETTVKDCTRSIQVERGTPQGGVGSPRLWNMLADDLLVQGDVRFPEAYKQSYADDNAWILSGPDPETLRLKGQEALRFVRDWAQSKGLSLSPEKTEAMILTRKRRRIPISLTLGGIEVPFKDDVKYLGVTIDRNLTWDAHCRRKHKTCTNIMISCRRAVGLTWGLKPRIMRWVYTAIVKPVLTYAAVVWLPAILSATKVTRLTKIQRLGCLMMTSAFHTTPTAAMERLMNLPPIDIHLARMAVEQSTRMINEETWRDKITPGPKTTHTRLVKDISAGIKELSLPSDACKPRNMEKRRYRIVIDDRKEAKKTAERLAKEGTVNIYTDGSRILENTGMGYIIQYNDQGIEESIPLGTTATVNQAEMLAIKTSAEKAKAEMPGTEPVTIFSDSQASLRALQTGVTKSHLTYECHNSLNGLGRQRPVTLRWVPGHEDITGNEVADYLAKVGSFTDFTGPEPALPVSRQYTKRVIREWENYSSFKRWRSLPTCRQSKKYIRGQRKEDLTDLLRMDKLRLRHVITTLTGHGNLGYHLQKMGIRQEDTCPMCETDVETPAHFIGKCPAFLWLRYGVLNYHTLEADQWTRIRYPTLSRYIEATGRLSIPTE